MGRARTDAFAKVPFLFGATEALALPGPILVHLLGDLGHGAASAKAILHRMVSIGLLDIERHGRVGVYRLSGRMRDGFETLRDGGAGPGWDGRFHTLVYDVPESQRALRDSFLGAARRFGYRFLRPGVLVGLHDNSAGLGDLLSMASVVSGWWSVDPDASRHLIASAWRLDAVAASQTQAAERLEALRADDLAGAEALAVLQDATADAFGLLSDQADLPASWLPPNWPASRLEAALASAMRELGPAVSAYVHDLIDGSRHRHLVVADPAWLSPTGARGSAAD